MSKNKKKGFDFDRLRNNRNTSNNTLNYLNSIWLDQREEISSIFRYVIDDHSCHPFLRNIYEKFAKWDFSLLFLPFRKGDFVRVTCSSNHKIEKIQIERFWDNQERIEIKSSPRFWYPNNYSDDQCNNVFSYKTFQFIHVCDLEYSIILRCFYRRILVQRYIFPFCI